MRERMKALVGEKDICVLATTSGGKPHCSLMAYVTDEACREIYMVTHKGTRKHQNLLENSSVSLLIDTREEHMGSRRSEAQALTISGTFGRIEEEEKRTLVRSMLLDRHPHLTEFVEHPEAELFLIKVGSFLLLDGLTNAQFEEF